jgi:hypothetical protein
VVSGKHVFLDGYYPNPLIAYSCRSLFGILCLGI